MEDKLLNVIKNEDKKNPYTDAQLSELLNISREKVLSLRHKYNIPGSSKRREKLIKESIEIILRKDINISKRKICVELNKQNINISTFGLKKFDKFIEEKRTHLKSELLKQNDKEKNLFSNDNSNFSNIIGHNGSLRQVIKLAKAAVIYPPYGLNTLIVGQTGVGKSQLVEEMHCFAKKVKNNNNIPLVVFNCADYADNPQLLVSQLFGYEKGSFTGATENKKGIIEKANGGILFLDEIHRLPPKGQEILFKIIDKGEYTPIGDTAKSIKVNVMIVGATTENIESHLLGTFRRRIPVTIEIPPLEERPMIERLEIIKKFFAIESSKINKNIKVDKEVLKILLTYKCLGNIGQLKSDIQLICAKAFLNSISYNKNEIEVVLHDVPIYLINQAQNNVEKNLQIKLKKIQDIYVQPNEYNEIGKGNAEIDDIYQSIEQRLVELKEQGMNEENMRMILSGELEDKIKNATIKIQNKYSGISKKILKNIVGEEIIDVVDDINKMLLAELTDYDYSLFNFLCLHLSTAIERIRSGKSIINPKLDKIKMQYQKEYLLAVKICNLVNMKLNIKFPEDEAGFIAMYLNSLRIKNKNYSYERVGLVVVTHGEVGKVMLEVAQSIVGAKVGTYVCMELSEKPIDVYKRVKETVKKENNGKGVLILVDMGSLISFGRNISKETSIETKTIARVDTLMVVQALKKCTAEASTLDNVYNSILEMENVLPQPYKKTKKIELIRRNAIITTCITGEGAAIKSKEIILEKFPQCKDIEIIPLGLVENDGDIGKRINCLKERYNILFAVGTVDPNYDDIVFISIDEILNNKKLEVIENLIKSNNSINFNCLKNLIDSDKVLVIQDKTNKDEILKRLVYLLNKQNCVNKEFYDDVIEREKMSDVYIGKGVVIPHSITYDNIIRPSLAMAVLKKSIIWGKHNVNIVLLLAIKPEQKNAFLKMFKIIKNTNFVDEILKANEPEIIIRRLLNYAK